jgi:hypothetical protein
MNMNREKVVFVETHIPLRDVYCQIGHKCKNLLVCQSFQNGLCTHNSPALIRIGSGFSTMQLAELALYSNGVRFLRNSLLELFSLSLSLHPPSALIW